MCLISTLSLACGQVERSTVASATTDGRGVSGSSQDVADQARIQQLIANLSQDHLSGQAQSELLAIAKRSPGNRDRVVQDLLADVDTHDELNQRSLILSKSFDYWFHVTRIFSLLQATEALDVMIQCVHCGNGMTGSLSVQPAFDALQAMGALAVPKLSQALGQHPQNIARGQIALCLGTIGGTEAEKALRHALQTETDEYVIRNIKRGLSTIANNPSQHQ